MTHKAIDCLVNVPFGDVEQQPGWMLEVRGDYFKGTTSMFAADRPDRVCVRFPKLRRCMIYGVGPWRDIAIQLSIRYENLRLMTSAWSPKRRAESLLHYMRTRGPNKVIFASDWPVLRQRRVLPEALTLDLPSDVMDNYLYDNARECFLRGLG